MCGLLYFLIACRARNAELFYHEFDGVEHRGLSLLQSLCWSFTIYGVNHHLLRLYLLYGIEPGLDERLSSVVNRLSIESTLHKHSLDDNMTIEAFQVADHLIDIIGG